MGQRIAIIGAGAVGGYAGAHMARAGEDVTFVDMWPENVEAMRANGLRISHLRDVPEFSVPVRALHLTELQGLAKQLQVGDVSCSLVMVAVKCARRRLDALELRGHQMYDRCLLTLLSRQLHLLQNLYYQIPIPFCHAILFLHKPKNVQALL